MSVTSKIILGIFVFIGVIAGIIFSVFTEDGSFDGYQKEDNVSLWSETQDLELDGQSPYSGPTQPNVSWVADIGGWGTEAVYGYYGTVYLGRLTVRSDKIGHIIALNPDGTEEWVFNITSGDDFLCNPVPKDVSEAYEESCSPVQADVASMAQADDGTIYAGLTMHDTGDPTRPRDFSQSRYVIALNPDGTEKWRLDIGPRDVKSRIAIDNQGILYFSSQKPNGPVLVSAVDPTEGQTIWTKEFRVQNMNGPAIGKNGILYFGGDKVRAVDSAFGTLIWEYDTKTVGAFPFGPAIGPDGTIYVASTSDFNLHAINPSGSMKWKMNIGFAELIPAIGPDGTIYIHTWEDLLGITNGSPKVKPGLHAINPDGTIQWSKEGFFQLTENELNDEDVRLAGQKFGGSDSSIIIDKNGTLYFGTDQGRIYAVDSKDGTVIFEARFRGEFDNRPVITPDGTLVLCHHGGGGLYEGARCIGMNDNGTMKPSPGVLIDDDNEGDGEDANNCFDVCVDVHGGTATQCLAQCTTGSDAPTFIPPGEDNFSRTLDSECMKRCFATGEGNAECNVICGLESEPDTVPLEMGYGACFDYCVDVEGKSEVQCNRECDF